MIFPRDMMFMHMQKWRISEIALQPHLYRYLVRLRAYQPE